jgi:hypothetical protein
MKPASLRKARERFFLDRLLTTATIDASISEPGEAPDFAIHLDDREIGVEVTEVFSECMQPRLRAHESLCQRVVTSARKRYENAGGAPLHTSISFSHRIDLETIHRETVAEAVAQELLRSPLPSGQYTLWRNDFKNPNRAPIAFINALGVSQREFAHWTVSAGGWLAPLSKELLQNMVQRKERQLETYRKRYREVWLLIASEGTTPSQFFDIDALTEPSSIQTQFDRTYFLESFSGRAIRLGTS